jgi:hypothetical protein
MERHLPIDALRHVEPAASPLVEATLSLVQDRVWREYRSSGLSWTDFRSAHVDTAIGRDDFDTIESTILASGYRFDWSAGISVAERPDIYRAAEAGDESFAHPDAPQGALEGGRALVGIGDNVVKYDKDITGTARFIRSNDRVLGYLTEGVPPETIAIIDDSGGTLTAPIIEQFAGVICAGGTVRSHLGILTREYNIPCFMNSRIAGIVEGDRLVLQASADARTTEDYQQGVERVGHVWRLAREGEA